MSSTTSAVRCTYTHTVPDGDSFATNSLAMLSPGWKLMLDVDGFVPHGNTVAYPFVTAPVMVRFTTTASASTGTPPRPATGTSTIPPDGTGPAPVNRPSADTNPARVSANRTGVNGTMNGRSATSHVCVAATKSPAAPMAMTLNVWVPGSNPVEVTGLAHRSIAPESSTHSTLVASVAVKANVASVDVVLPAAGASVIVTDGFAGAGAGGAGGAGGGVGGSVSGGSSPSSPAWLSSTTLAA